MPRRRIHRKQQQPSPRTAISGILEAAALGTDERDERATGRDERDEERVTWFYWVGCTGKAMDRR